MHEKTTNRTATSPLLLALLTAFIMGLSAFAADPSPEQKAYDEARRARSSISQKIFDHSLKAEVAAAPFVKARDTYREIEQAIQAAETETGPQAAEKRKKAQDRLKSYRYNVYAHKCLAYLSEDTQGKKLVDKYGAAERAVEQAFANLVHARGEVLPHEWFQTLPRPSFKEGHSLLKLSRFGWSIPFELKVELADHWGYALPISGYLGDTDIDLLNVPFSEQARLVELAKRDSDTYKIAVILNRHFPANPPEGTWTRDADGHRINGQGKSIDGTEWGGNQGTVISLTAPDALAEEMGRGRAGVVARLRERVPISIILNGGEYGLGVYGFAGPAWEKYPDILAAKGDRSWFAFISQRKSHHEKIIADIVIQAARDADAYVYYTVSAGGDRNRYGHVWKWLGADFKDLHVISDFVSEAVYYSHWNSGFMGEIDILTKRLNGIPVELAHNRPLAYHWFWAGMQDKKCDINRYRGLIKMIYITGCIGGNAGNYDNSARPTSFKPDAPGFYYQEMVALARVHALFSHLDTYIRDGDLLPGEHCHPWSKSQSAYEFLPQELAKTVALKEAPEAPKPILPPGRPVRVLVRKYRPGDEWLVGAWAADGKAQPATVNISGAGTITLNARPGGSVYLIRKNGDAVEMHLCDPDEAYPSRSFVPPPWW